MTSAGELLPQKRCRRDGISGSSFSPEQIRNFVPPFYAKSADDQQFIRKVVDCLPVLFGHISSEARDKVIDAFQDRTCIDGEMVIQQGDMGDYFYVVHSGKFAVSVKRSGMEVAEVVLECSAGGSFGELALLYNAPRAATVASVGEGSVWALDRDSFRMMLVTSENTKKDRWEGFLSEVDLFKVLNTYEKKKISNILKVQNFSPGQSIMREGARGDKFYILEEGFARATMFDQLSEDEISVKDYTKGDFFGELALVNGSGVRAASVYALTRCVLLWIDKVTFDRVFGPLISRLKVQAAAYPSLEDIMSNQDSHSSMPSSSNTAFTA